MPKTITRFGKGAVGRRGGFHPRPNAKKNEGVKRKSGVTGKQGADKDGDERGEAFVATSRGEKKERVS